MNNQISGSNRCWKCGSDIDWVTKPIVQRGVIVVYDLPNNPAEATAIGKNDDGSLACEVTCECKRCGIRNKFIVNYK